MLSEDGGESALGGMVGKEVIMAGTVAREPDTRENSTRLVVVADSVILKARDKETDIKRYDREKILVVASPFPEFEYGDFVSVKGKLEKPENFKTESNKIFDYNAYLAKEGIYYVISFADVSLVERKGGNFLKSGLYSLKHLLIGNLEKVLPEPHSSLASGVLVGGKNSLGKELEDDFRVAGIIHIIVLSGYNIMIVADYIMKFFSFLPRLGGLWAASVGIVAFAIMTGGSATVVRASIMAILALVARSVGRIYLVNRALFVAGFAMILHNPKILAFDFSFQLSFLATLGLIHLAPIVEKRLSFITRKYNLREYIVSTVATQIIVLPLILYRMGEMSLVAVPVNALVLFFIPWTMLASFLASIAAFFGGVIALPFSFVAYVLIEYELKVVEVFASLPYASVEVGGFGVYAMLFAYAIYIVGYWYSKRRHPIFR